MSRQHEFVRDSGATMLRELVGDGLLTREEPLHKERRRVLQPAFHRDQIASYAAIMTVEAERMANAWRDEEVIDVRQQMRRLTLSIVGAALFGTEFRDEAAELAGVLDGVVKRAARIAPAFALFEPAALFYRRLNPRGRSVLFAKERAALERLIQPILEKRRLQQGRDVMSLLMNSGISDEDIQNEVITFVLAGHETTATALTWTWKLLAEHPEAAQRMRAELASVLGGRAPGLNDVPALDYTGKVFKEAMRLYPPASLFARRPKSRITLAGYRIERGESIFLSPYISQRNPKYFDQPDSFRPERWEAGERKRFAYFPFGGGAKMCIGEPFARLEGVLALAALGQVWRLEREGLPEIAVRGGTLATAGQPVPMRCVGLRKETTVWPRTANERF